MVRMAFINGLRSLSRAVFIVYLENQHITFVMLRRFEFVANDGHELHVLYMTITSSELDKNVATFVFVCITKMPHVAPRLCFVGVTRVGRVM